MKKVSSILFLVGGIYSVVCAVIFLMLGGGFIVLSGPAFTAYIVEGIKNGTINTTFEGITPEEIAAIVQALFVGYGIGMIFFTVLSTVNAVVSFMARKSANKGMMIANIILGAVSCMVVNLVGGIFGLIALKKEANSGEFVR